MSENPESSSSSDILEPRLWQKSGWTARVIKNDGDDGWAVEMTRAGDTEPALVGPWTMGRDKKNPKPLDQSAFITLVKTASEVLLRHQQQRRAQLHRSLTVTAADGGRIRVDLDVVPDEDMPHAVLAAFDPAGNELGSVQVRSDFKLTQASASRFVEDGFTVPGAAAS